MIVGIYAETFDHHTFVNNILILPLTFLGGVFYSVEPARLAVAEISHAQPDLLPRATPCATASWGPRDVSVVLALGITAVLAAATVAWSSWLFATGKRLKA